MKKRLGLIISGLGLLSLIGISFGLSIKAQEKIVNEPIMVLAEEETSTEELPCKVLINTTKHGSIEVDITEGNVGDICTITAKHDFLYKVESVSVNTVALIESEETANKFSFALVEGDNVISASFVVDEELCGKLTQIVKEAGEKDWTNLFTVENVIILVKWILDGGILIAVIRYFVKDKRLEKKLETKVEETVKNIIPETTKTTTVATVEKVITPMFTEMKADYVEIMKALNVYAKCMALSQDSSADSKRAILDELSGLKIGDLETIGEVKKSIDEMIERHTKAYEETLAAIKEIVSKNEGTVPEEVVEDSEDRVISGPQATE